MSIKTNNNKFTLLNQKFKYGTDAGINVRNGTLYTNPATNRTGINTFNPTANLDISGTLNAPIITDYGGSSGNDTQQLLKISNQNVWGYNQNIFKGSDMFIINTITNLSPALSLSGSRPLAGPVLAPNGKIYAVPNSDSFYCIIDPNTDTFTIKRSILGGGCSSAACAHNGKLYAPSLFGSNLLRVLNTNNDTETILQGSIAQGYYGAVLGPNGKIYAIPSDTAYTSGKVMVINSVNDNISYIDISATIWPGGGNPGDISGGIGNANGDDLWYGGALAPNGKIYCMPARATSILVIDTNNDTAECDISGLSGFAVAPAAGGLQNKYGSAVLAPNGKIYGLPGVNASVVIEIDPSSNTYVNTSMTISGGRKCVGGTLAPDGRIYCTTDNAGVVAIINTNRTPYTISTISSSRMNGSCLGPNGKIYCMPNLSAGGSVLIRTINTGIPVLQPWMMAPEFNKF